MKKNLCYMGMNVYDLCLQTVEFKQLTEQMKIH